MKKIKLLLLIFLLLTTAFTFSGCGYNMLVSLEEQVNSAWANVETQYQRRADLIPNLVKIVEGSATFEKNLLTEVTEMRSKVGQVKLSPEDLSDEEKFRQFEQAQNNLSGSLSRLLVVVENYPDIKSTEAFKNLQVDLAGTENRIATARKRFNDAVQEYNTTVRRFPTIITAKIFGFKEKQYFKSKEGSEQAPEIKFNFDSDKNKK
ncbi:MAG: LemA family protein [Ignavibacteria bacterium]